MARGYSPCLDPSKEGLRSHSVVECLLSMHEALGEVPRGHNHGLGIWGVQGIELQDWFL